MIDIVDALDEIHWYCGIDSGEWPQSDKYDDGNNTMGAKVVWRKFNTALFEGDSYEEAERKAIAIATRYQEFAEEVLALRARDRLGE